MSEDFDDDFASIEHVYPQKASADYWKDRFGKYNSKQKTALRNSLGNLVALSSPKNSALGNRSFPEKKKGTAETSGYVAGSYSEIEVSQYEDWTAEAIFDRGLKMIAFMEKRWNFKLNSKEARAKALGLSFLLEASDAGKQGEDDTDD